MINTRWSKAIVEWQEDGVSYLSIPFTWLLPKARSRCIELQAGGYEVRVGGPAVDLMPNYLADVADIGGRIPVLWRHNPEATFTSHGCIRNCPFCAVPRIEGPLVEVEDWVPGRIVCDNNLLACSQWHFDNVVDRLVGIKGVDTNQGLDARLLKPHHVEQLQRLDLALIRFAWDNVNLESTLWRAVEMVRGAGFPSWKIRVYVLVGYDDTPEDALYRCEALKAHKILPNVQRFQPLDALVKNAFVAPVWTEDQLVTFCRYWNRQVWLSKVPYGEYHYGGR